MLNVNHIISYSNIINYCPPTFKADYTTGESE